MYLPINEKNVFSYYVVFQILTIEIRFLLLLAKNKCKENTCFQNVCTKYYVIQQHFETKSQFCVFLILYVQVQPSKLPFQ